MPNSHRATSDPSRHRLKELMKLKMMKGDIIVCNALTIHAGYGYGAVTNIRFHMYLLNRNIHLDALYNVNRRSKKKEEESTTPGNEISVFFIEDNVKYNTTKIISEVISERKDSTTKKRLCKTFPNLQPGRKPFNANKKRKVEQ